MIRRHQDVPEGRGADGSAGAACSGASAGRAGLAAGARPVLVPTPDTRTDEVEAAPEVHPDLLTAVRALLGEVAA